MMPHAPAIVDAPSTNHGERRGVDAPDMVLLHYTAMESAEAALARLRDPAAEVSAHYLIGADGRVWRLVPEDRRAWHAGVARWGGAEDLNSRSIGIELDNPGDAPFAEPQMRALETLLGAVLARWSIPPERVLGHQCVAPGRKRDPGPRFDWRRLARLGLSVWLDWDGMGDDEADPAAFQRAAAAFGYPLSRTGAWDDATRAVADAFRARFRPADRTPGPASGAALAHLEALAARWPVAQGAVPV